MGKTAVFCIALAVILVLPVFASPELMLPLSLPTASSNGFGGTHVAYTDDVFALLVNPAAITRVEQRSFFTLAPSLLNPESTYALINPLMDLLNNDTNALVDMADTLSKQKGKITLGLELREFPFSIAWVADGFGFGLWSRFFLNFNIIGDYLEANAYGDVMLPIGFAFKILDLERHSVDAGVTIKPFVRVMALAQENFLDLADSLDDFINDFSVPVIAGAGLNLGLLYRWDIGFQAGLTFDDVYSYGAVVHNFGGTSSADSYYFPFRMNLGIAYDFRIGRFVENAPGLVKKLGFTFAADWRDMTNAFIQKDYLYSRNLLLDFGVGLQVSLFDIGYVRLGMNEMLPCFGLGCYLGPVKLDLAYYGKEYGYEPGQLSAAVVDLSIAIRPGAKKRDWPWTRRSIFGLAGIEREKSPGIDASEIEEQL